MEKRMNPIERLVRTARRRSPWLFHLNSGGCNGCDIELAACLSPRYDVEQAGILLVGSPRHADILCVTGPITTGSREALETIHSQIAGPRVVIAIGTCPASCDVFAGSPAIAGPLQEIIPVDVFVPGCPPRPNDIIAGVVRAITLLSEKGRTGGAERVP